MSGEGGSKPPHVVGKLCADGEWRVLVRVPLQPPVWDAEHELLLDADQAERLARQLLEYASLVSDRRGLASSRPTASLLEGEA